MEIGKRYTMRISKTLSDCANNFMDDTIVNFALPQMPLYNDILINEILYHPHYNGSDFIELYNKSTKNISLKSIYIGKKNENGEIVDITALSEEDRILFPSDFCIVTDNCADIKNRYVVSDNAACVELSSLPSFPNTEGNVYIFSKSGETIDGVNYSDNMHFALLKNTEGISLERINYNVTSSEPTNWQSAAEQAGFATPGYENSQFMSTGTNSNAFSIFTKVCTPDGDGYNDHIVMNYSFDSAGSVATISIFSDKGIRVKDICKNKMLETSGTIFWDGTNNIDEFVASGIYIFYIEAFDNKGNSINEKLVCSVVY